MVKSVNFWKSLPRWHCLLITNREHWDLNGVQAGCKESPMFSNIEHWTLNIETSMVSKHCLASRPCKESFSRSPGEISSPADQRARRDGETMPLKTKNLFSRKWTITLEKRFKDGIKKKNNSTMFRWQILPFLLTTMVWLLRVRRMGL